MGIGSSWVGVKEGVDVLEGVDDGIGVLEDVSDGTGVIEGIIEGLPVGVNMVIVGIVGRRQPARHPNNSNPR